MFKQQIICKQCNKELETIPSVFKRKPLYVVCSDCQRANKVLMVRLWQAVTGRGE